MSLRVVSIFKSRFNRKDSFSYQSKPKPVLKAQELTDSRPKKKLNLTSSSYTEFKARLREALPDDATIKDYERAISAMLIEANKKSEVNRPNLFNIANLSCFFNIASEAIKSGLDFSALNQQGKEELLLLGRKTIDFLRLSDKTDKKVNAESLTKLIYGLEAFPDELRREFLLEFGAKVADIENFNPQQISKIQYCLRNMPETPLSLLKNLRAKYIHKFS